MESILFWALVIAAIAIVSMLGLLIASERNLKRTRAELGKMRSAFEGVTAARTDSVSAEKQQVNAKVALLSEQLQSSQATIARMRGEIQALRAESWRREESASRRLEGVKAEAMPGGQLKRPNSLLARYGIGKGRYKARPVFVAGAVVVLLAAVAAFSYTGMRRAKPELAQIVTPATQPVVEGNAAPEPGPGTGASPVDAAMAVDKPEAPQVFPPASVPVKTPPLLGTNYQVVRSTRVFSERNDRSRPLARVEAGMEITVVGVQNDWLEVRSLHGRPSGFIKSDAAVIKEPR